MLRPLFSTIHKNSSEGIYFTDKRPAIEKKIPYSGTGNLLLYRISIFAGSTTCETEQKSWHALFRARVKLELISEALCFCQKLNAAICTTL